MFRGMFSFYPERAILSKERASGSYYISAYFLAKSLSEVPLTTAFPAIYLCICHPLTNSNPAATSFLGTVLTQSLTNLCAESVGLFIGAATATLTELNEPFGINDNLSIPLASSVAMTWAFARMASCERDADAQALYDEYFATWIG